MLYRYADTANKLGPCVAYGH